MAYQIHDVANGDVIQAQTTIEQDTQIAANESAIGQLQTKVNQIETNMPDTTQIESDVSALQNSVNGINMTLGTKMNEPTTEGTNGQVLTTDGNGNRTWTTVQGGASVEIDDTLTQQGEAADAKAAGDALATKLAKPATDGTNGQVLMTDGQGGASWQDAMDSTAVESAVGSYINAHPEVITIADGSVTQAKLATDVTTNINSISNTATNTKARFEQDATVSSFFIPNTGSGSYQSYGVDERYIGANNFFKEIYKPDKLEGHTIGFSFYINQNSTYHTRFAFMVDGNTSSYPWYPSYADNIIPTGVIRLFSPTYGELYVVVNQDAMLNPGDQTVFKLQCNDHIYDLSYSPTIARALSDIDPAKIPDQSIAIKKTNFIYKDFPETANILDPAKGVVGSYYAGSASTASISFTPTTNQYTGHYVAYDLELQPGRTHICFCRKGSYEVYWYGFTNDNGVVLARGGSNGGNVPLVTTDGYCTAIPEGATHLLISFKQAATIWNGMLANPDNPTSWFIANYGETPIVAYKKYEQRVGVLGHTLAYLSDIPGHEEEETETHPYLKLPRKYDLVVGDTFELFYNGVINAINTDVFDVEFTGTTHGKVWARKYEWTPSASDVGNHNYTVSLASNDCKTVDTMPLTLSVHAVPTSPSEEQVILCMGDSLTTAGTWPQELRRRLIGTGGTPAGLGLSNITFIGTKTLSDGTRYEGYGGWHFSNYTNIGSSSDRMIIYGTFDKTDDDQHSVWTDTNNVSWKLETINADSIIIIRQSGSGTLPASGTLTWQSGGIHTNTITYTSSAQGPANPFWDVDSNDVNFAAYMQRMGVTKIDNIIILLGWNSTYETTAAYKTQIQAFLDKVFAQMPNVKVTLLGLQRPSRDGLANNNSFVHYPKMLSDVKRVNELYQTVADEYTADNKNVEYVDIAGQFDNQYGCQTLAVPANNRTTTTVTIQSNGVHPNNLGQMQIADAAFRNIVTKL